MAEARQRTFREKLADYECEPDQWETVATHSDKASRKGARRHGTSVQQIYKNKNTGELIVRHTVIDNTGRTVDDHLRPHYKPRPGDLDDDVRQSNRD